MKRIIAVILSFVLMLSALPVLAEVDYASDYEAALTLALNDLTNKDGLREAIDMLQRLGGYQLAKAYAQYLQAVLDIQSGADSIRTARLRITASERNAKLVEDLETRGFPSCEEIRSYADARELEAAGDYGGAFTAFAEMSILDAPDRAVELILLIDSSDYTVRVVHRTEEGTVLAETKEAIQLGGEITVRARTDFEGYVLTADSKSAVTVKVDELGNQNLSEAVFVYRKLPDTVPVAVVYRTNTGMELARETADVVRGGSLTVEAKTFDGYDLTSSTPEKVQVFADNMGKLSQAEVVFTYRIAKPKVAVGDYVIFGHYPQKASGNDNTPIEWLVLDVQDGKALLISRYGLDAQPYNNEYTATTWEQCTLRTWLNGTFLYKAFTAQEREAILLTDVDNGWSQGFSSWGTYGGNNTRDQIFLLSYAEAGKYLDVTHGNSKNNKSRVAPTSYSIKKGAANVNVDGTAAGWWWLRSPGGTQRNAASVNRDGSLRYIYVYSGSGCVRPALWLNLDSDIF
ncbi:MAG: MucBP domain-containing protein [Clostridia bacterium]|nr:MucBP domain-containing protein [Clostridia bacterium]